MKKSLRKLLIAVVVMLTMLSGNLTYAQVVLNSSQRNGVVLNQNAFNGIRATSSFAGFNHFDVTTKEGVFTEITAEGHGFTWEEGEPMLPVMRKLIEIPLGARPEVTVVSYDVKEYKLSDLGIKNKIMPTQPAVSKSADAPADFVISKQAYTSNRFNENTLASVEVVGILRNTRLARIDISPVQYNPVQGTIRVYSNVVVDVQFTGADYAATSELKAKTRSPYFGGFNFLNTLPVEAGDRVANFTRYPVKMVIVSDPMFQTALQPFIQWKRKKGFTIVEAYTNNSAVGKTTTSIKNYLKGLYNAGTASDPAPSFVLFVGDVAQIPAFSQGGHITDLDYCEYTGDYIPDAFYGRFSANTVAQLQPQIDKTLMYEQYQFPDPSFLNRVLLISGVDYDMAPRFGNGQITYGTNNYFNHAHGLTSHTYLHPASGSAAPAIRQNVSDGVAYGNYTAHGFPDGWSDPAFKISHITNLNNYGKYPLLVGNCCLTGKFDETSFGEALLRAENKGAIGYIGASNNTYWYEDFFFGVGNSEVSLNVTYQTSGLGSYDCAFHDHGEPFEKWFTTQAQMMVAGNLAVTESASPRKLYYWQVYGLMGDPSLSVYFGEPNQMTASYSALMPLQSGSFTVNTQPYAYVAISKEGVLYGSALANENGVAEVLLNPITTPGNADIVITAQNRQPYFGTVLVASTGDGPYVLLQSQTVNDAAGNNNQKADYGEHFGFDISLKNFGAVASNALTATLSSTSPYVNLLTATKTWPNIAPGAVITLNNTFEVVAGEWLPDQHDAIFELTVTNGTNTWNSSFTIKLNAPLLKVGSMTINDNGNSNGMLNPGEEAVITIQVKNDGQCLAPATKGYLFSKSEWVQVSEVQTTLGDIASKSQKETLYNVSLSASAPVGTMADFYFSSTSGVYNASKIFSLKVEDFETGGFNTLLPWVNTSPVPWIITTSTVNGGTYAARSGQISHNGETSLQISMNVLTDDFISFAGKVSSDSDYDWFKFYIDGVERSAWSGEKDWTTYTYGVSPGSHTFKWTYSKDYSGTEGTDAAYIDDIVFPSSQGGGTGTAFGVKAFAYPTVVCEGGDANLFAFVENAADNAIAYSWTPAGMLSNPNSSSPVATVENTTTFTIAASKGSSNATAQIEIVAKAKPQTPTIQQTETQLTSSATNGNQWYNAQGLIQDAVNQVYVPESTNHYYVIVTGDNGCISDPSASVYFAMVGMDTPENSGALNVYPNPFRNQLNIDFSIKQQGKVKISLLNLVGQEIRVVEESTFVGGNHSLTFNANGLLPGIYFLKMESGNGVDVKKVVLSK